MGGPRGGREEKGRERKGGEGRREEKGREPQVHDNQRGDPQSEHRKATQRGDPPRSRPSNLPTKILGGTKSDTRTGIGQERRSEVVSSHWPRQLSHRVPDLPNDIKESKKKTTPKDSSNNRSLQSDPVKRDPKSLANQVDPIATHNLNPPQNGDILPEDSRSSKDLVQDHIIVVHITQVKVG